MSVQTSSVGDVVVCRAGDGGAGDGSCSDDLFPEVTVAAAAVARKRKRQVKKLSRKAARGTLTDISPGDAAECARRGVHMAARVDILDAGVSGAGGHVSVAALRDLLLSLYAPRGGGGGGAGGLRWATLRNGALVPYAVVLVAHGVSAADAAAALRGGDGAASAVTLSTRVYHDRASSALDRLIFGSTQSALPPAAAAPVPARVPIVAPVGMPGPEAYLLSDELRAAWGHPSAGGGGGGCGGAEAGEAEGAAASSSSSCDEAAAGDSVGAGTAATAGGGGGGGEGGAGAATSAAASDGVVDIPIVELASIAGRAAATAEAGARPRMLAIDCEMCATGAGLELTRLTAVDEALAVVYDSYVLPERPIRDYLTQYSGVTPALLEGVRTRLVDARAALGALVCPSDILVGHSLENDLRVLRLAHGRLLDTAALFPHPAGPPRRSSLKFLAQRYLGRAIQVGSGGHDSAEDAAAAMQLAQLKISHGALFGVERKGRAANLFQQVARARGDDDAGPGPRCSMLTDASSLRAYVAGSASAVRTDPGRWDEAGAAVARAIGSFARAPVGGGAAPGLIVAELRTGAAGAGGGGGGGCGGGGGGGGGGAAAGAGDGTAAAAGLAACIARVRGAMAPNSLLLVLTQPRLPSSAADDAGTKVAMVGAALIEVVGRGATASAAPEVASVAAAAAAAAEGTQGPSAAAAAAAAAT